jgi:hypothetical protein
MHAAACLAYSIVLVMTSVLNFQFILSLQTLSKFAMKMLEEMDLWDHVLLTSALGGV